jgi:multicomponent Na+:H+ antiporter subunit E
MQASIIFTITSVIFWIICLGPAISSMQLVSIISIFIALMIVKYFQLMPKYVTAKLTIITYIPWLFYEIIKSSLQVVKFIWGAETNQFTCATEWIKSSQNTPTGLAIYANSITLTPGTVTIDINQEQLLIHALDKTGLLSLNDMDNKIKNILK